MAKEHLTDEQVETEIAMLLESPNVKLAKRDEYVRNRRRQYLYNLRSYEKRGKELAKMGITMRLLESMLKGCEEDNDYKD
jgi:hypothetical protein